MTIHLPTELESALQAEVLSGQFHSLDDAMAEAVRMLLTREHTRSQVPTDGQPENPGGMGLIGALRDDAELLDQAVAHAMKVREERPWRLPSGE